MMSLSCVLCLENLKPLQHDGIGIFSAEGLSLNISSIISKHFWLKPKEPDQEICGSCWQIVRDFHQLYERVLEAHQRLETKSGFAVDVTEDDPLPHEVLLKSEQVSSAGQLVEALGESFFDPEVKVEVHDLDLLPQIEIIEGTGAASLSDRTLRARRGRQCKEESAARLALAAKRIKREGSQSSSNIDSETELPLAVLVTGFKTDQSDGTPSANAAEALKQKTRRNQVAAVEPVQKKKRGRPRKVKEEPVPAVLTKSEEAPAPITQSTNVTNNIVKAEQAAGSDSDDEDGGSGSAAVASGTDDSDSSSSSSSSSSGSSDSNDSLPDAEPPERYAHIPKRVVVKPKKYQKRPKPVVPPRRMTREEIERKNAQQAEYDKVIAQFFGKFVCPKCNLLVQNFGDMKKHFRASHFDEPGYMSCCGRKFHLRRALAEHVYVHWNPEHFKCETCSRVFQDARALEVHEQTHTNPPEIKEKKTFQCDKCPKAFTTKAAFEYHSYSKHVPKSEFKFTCPECNKKLPTERKFKDHMKYMHDPESAIICDKCGKQVRSQSNLKKHHQIEHSDVPRPVPVPKQCEICGTWLRHLAGLKQHMKTIHEDAGGEHRCHICNKTSTNARALKRHIYHNHECERKFKCTMCEKAFKRPQDLREHTSTHTGEVLYTCPNCPMTFFSNANMYKHRQRLHRAEWESDKKKPRPPNIMQQAVGATAAMKMQQAVGAASSFFANKQRERNMQLGTTHPHPHPHPQPQSHPPPQPQLHPPPQPQSHPPPQPQSHPHPHPHSLEHSVVPPHTGQMGMH